MSSYYQGTRRIILMQHGFMGNASSLYGLAQKLKGIGGSNGFAVYDVPAINKSTSVTVGEGSSAYEQIITSGQRLDLWAQAFNTFYQNNPTKDIYVRTEFANGFSSVPEQREELKLIVDKIRSATGFNGKFHLVGHSKGGLVNLEFTMKYSGEVDKVVSIATPYGTGRLTKLVGDIFDVIDNVGIQVSGPIQGLANITSESYLTDLRTRWVNHSKKDSLYAIGGVSIRLVRKALISIKGFSINFLNEEVYETDGVVDLDDQIGVDNNPAPALGIPAARRVVHKDNALSFTTFSVIEEDWTDRVAQAIADIAPFTTDLAEVYFGVKYFDALPVLLGIGTGVNLLNQPFSHINICNQTKTANSVVAFLG